MDVDAANIDGHGNFLWTFANSESIGDTQMGILYVLLLLNMNYQDSLREEHKLKKVITSKVSIPEDGRPKFRANGTHLVCTTR